MDFSAALKEEAEIVDAIIEPEALPPGPALSLVAVKSNFQEFLAVIDTKIQAAKEIVVQDEASQKEAVALVGEAKKIIKEIDARKKSLPSYKLAKEFLDSLNAFANDLTSRFQNIVSLADPKVRAYMAKVELERRKQEEAARKAAAELQRKIDEEAAEANRKAREEATRKAEEDARAKQASEAEIEAAKKKAEEEAAKNEIMAPTVAAPVIPKSNSITRAENGVSAFAKRPWKVKVIDEDLVPREFCSSDKKKLDNAVKQGLREIPGCEIYQDTQVNYR